MTDAVHRYRAACHWEGSTLVGYAQYSRRHSLTVEGLAPGDTQGLAQDSGATLGRLGALDGGPGNGPSPGQSLAPLALSGDPAFHGDGDLLNPEQLLLAAAVSCQLLSFLAAAAKARIDVLEYRDNAEAEMPEGDRPVRITRITLRPEILVAVGPSEDRVRELVAVGHRECFIANSLKSEIVLEPSVAFVGGGG